MSSDNDIYCSRCDVVGHDEGTAECDVYYNEVEAPYNDAKRARIGEIVAAGESPPDLYAAGSEDIVDISPGALLRIIDWTPWRTGFKAGDYWTVETLDGKYSGTQIYDDELVEPGVLDQLWLKTQENNDTTR